MSGDLIVLLACVMAHAGVVQGSGQELVQLDPVARATPHSSIAPLRRRTDVKTILELRKAKEQAQKTKVAFKKRTKELRRELKRNKRKTARTGKLTTTSEAAGKKKAKSMQKLERNVKKMGRKARIKAKKRVQRIHQKIIRHAEVRLATEVDSSRVLATVFQHRLLNLQRRQSFLKAKLHRARAARRIAIKTLQRQKQMEVGLAAAKRDLHHTGNQVVKLSQKVQRIQHKISRTKTKLRAVDTEKSPTKHKPSTKHNSATRRKVITATGIHSVLKAFRGIRIDRNRSGMTMQRQHKSQSVHVPIKTLKFADPHGFHMNNALSAKVMELQAASEHASHAKTLKLMKEISVLSQAVENRVLRHKSEQQRVPRSFRNIEKAQHDELKRAYAIREISAVLNANIKTDITPASRVSPGWQPVEKKRTAQRVTKALSYASQPFSSSNGVTAKLVNAVTQHSTKVAAERLQPLQAYASSISPEQPRKYSSDSPMGD